MNKGTVFTMEYMPPDAAPYRILAIIKEELTNNKLPIEFTEFQQPEDKTVLT